MAVKWILTQGIGFSPGSVKYLPTLGFISSSSTASPWVRIREVVSLGDDRSVSVVGDARGLTSVGDQRRVAGA